MKKIMFNDKYGLTQVVLNGRKTMTRRIVTDKKLHYWKRSCPDMVIVKVPDSNKINTGDNNVYFGIKEKISDGYYCDTIVSPYELGEVVAVAQSYSDCGNMPDYGLDEDGYPIMPKRSAFFNKMFVKSDLMPHHIKVIGVCCERLQDISDEDCLKEGIYRLDSANGNGGVAYSFVGASEEKNIGLYSSPREAFIPLIDKVSGKGTWERNPFVFVYEFELID